MKEKEKECLREIEVENGGEDGYSGVAAEVKTMAVAAKVMAEVVVEVEVHGCGGCGGGVGIWL